MAQVKKLQSGGASPSTTQIIPKKRMYNGVELTDADLDRIVNDTAEFISKNSNYSEDVRGISDLSNKIKEELKRGNMPEFDPTGTGLKIGDINIDAGKHNQNIFGNFSGDKLGREFAFRLKEGFDSYTKSSENSQSTVAATPTEKYHSGLARTISDRYFGGNWENAQKGIGELTPDKRLAYVKQGLKDSILKYKQEYGEDSKYSNRLAEIDTATPERIKEIAYEMGMDATDFLEGTAEQREASKAKAIQNDPYYELRQQGEIIEDDYLASKGLIGFKDKKGVTHLLFKNDPKQPYTDTNPVLETSWGQHYGKGIFYNPTLGYNWGDRNKFKTDTNYFNIAEPFYAQQEAKTKAGIQGSINSIDFNTQFDPTFAILKDTNTNKFDYIDATKYFSGLTTGNQRLIIPKNRIKYTSIGDIDLNNLNAYMYDKDLNKTVPVTIKLNTTGSSQAIGINGTVYDLGVIGDNLGNTSGINTTYNTSLGDYSDVDSNIEERLRGRVVGFENRLVNKNNISDFLYQVNRQNFTKDLSAEEAKNLSNLVKKYYTQYKPSLSQQSIINIQRALSKFDTSISDIKTNKQFYESRNSATSSFKKGGIIKYQVGGGIKSAVSDKIKPLAKTTNPNLGYGSARISDLNTSTFSDNADMVATGLDALSLAGGAVGVGAGLASTLVQAVGDSNRSGFLSNDMLNNLGINLGFTALAFIPGASAAKIGKIAKTANKLNNATKFIKDTEKAVKILSKVENLSDDAKKALKAVDMAKKVITDAEKGKDVTKFINKVTLNPFVKGAATTARVGFSGLGISSGIESAKNIIEDKGNARISDIRGLVAGFAGARAATGMVKNSLIRKGTELKTPINKVQTEIAEDASKLSKIKAKTSDSAKNISNKTSNFVKEKITDNWENRKLKSEEGAKWLTKLGINQAKKVGFTEDGLGRNVNQKLIDVLNNESKLTSKPRLALPEYKLNVVNKSISGKYPIADEPYDPVKAFQASVNNLLKVNNVLKSSKKITLEEFKKEFNRLSKNMRGIEIPKNKVKYKKANVQRVKGLKNNGLVDKSGQVSMKFKQGGRLIPKFQNSGQLNWTLQNNDEKNYFKQPTYLDRLFQTQNSNLKNRLEKVWNPNSPIYKSGESTETISGEQIKTPIYNTKFRGNPGNPTPKITVTASKGGDKKTEYTPYNKKTLSVNPTQLLEFTKLADAIGTNRKVSQELRGISPVMPQTTSAIHKSVVTNLANQNFVNNQVNSYLHQASKPMTSDASLQKGMQLEALSKTTPMIIQAKAANTDMYNQTLGASRDNDEKYVAMSTEAANARRAQIGANEARIAQIGATELAVNKESRNAFTDEMIKNYKEKSMRDFQVKNQLELNRLSTEFNNKLKPYSTRYNELLNDPKTSSIYQRAKAWHSKFPNKNLEDYTENGKTYHELLSLEQSNAQKAYETESEKLKPYYETAMINLRGGDPYNRTYSFGTYKKGGSIDAKVEIQNLKNKMKAKEINAKSDDKAKDRNERAVAAILKSMSKESLFLLKTMLGK